MNAQVVTFGCEVSTTKMAFEGDVHQVKLCSNRVAAFMGFGT
jgi:hypothetical protein